MSENEENVVKSEENNNNTSENTENNTESTENAPEPEFVNDRNSVIFARFFIYVFVNFFL